MVVSEININVIYIFLRTGEKQPECPGSFDVFLDANSWLPFSFFLISGLGNIAN